MDATRLNALCTNNLHGLLTRKQARARELVRNVLGSRDPTTITRVQLSNKSYSVGAAKVISETLKKMTNVTEVRLSIYLAFYCEGLLSLSFSLCLYLLSLGGRPVHELVSIIVNKHDRHLQVLPTAETDKWPVQHLVECRIAPSRRRSCF